VAEEAIIRAIIAGDIAKLRRWARQGVRLVSAKPFSKATLLGSLDIMRCLVKEFDADVNQTNEEGTTALVTAVISGKFNMVRFLVRDLGADVNQSPVSSPLLFATVKGNVEMMRCLVKELGANVNHAEHILGATALFAAVEKGTLDMVRFVVKDLGADVNQAKHDGVTPLMAANGIEIVRWLVKNGANTQASVQQQVSVADVSRQLGRPAEQSSYLEARAHCASPSCGGAGIKKCAGCLEVFYCCRTCQLAHWPVHKADCKRRAQLKANVEI
jgi:hypothetical protein